MREKDSEKKSTKTCAKREMDRAERTAWVIKIKVIEE